MFTPTTIVWFLFGCIVVLIHLYINKILNNHKKVKLKDVRIVLFPSHSEAPILNGVEMIHEESQTFETSPDVCDLPIGIHYHNVSESLKEALIAKGYKPDW